MLIIIYLETKTLGSLRPSPHLKKLTHPEKTYVASIIISCKVQKLALIVFGTNTNRPPPPIYIYIYLFISVLLAACEGNTVLYTPERRSCEGVY